MAGRLTIGDRAEEGGPFRAQVARLRTIVAAAPGDVLATSKDAVPTAALAWAAWAQRRRIVFAPTGQPAALEALTSTRPLITLDGTEEAAGTSGFVEASDDETTLAEFHTSGSTGTPETFGKRGRQLVGEARYLAEAFGITDDDTILSGVPACHLYGFLFSVMLPSVTGCQLVDATPLYPETTVRLSDEMSATVLISTPAELRALSAADRLPNVRRVFSSGSPLPARVRDHLLERGMTVTEIFGSTETGGIAWREGGTTWTTLGPVEVRETGGLMHVRSPFIEDPASWFEMNDQIELGADGRFRHLGRSDDIVKVGAKRVSKEALRTQLLAFENVTDVAVGQLLDGERPGTLHAFVTTSGDVSADGLRRALGATFDPVTVPRIHFVEQLPRTALGKISQAALHQLIGRTEREIDFGVPVQNANGLLIPMRVPTTCRYFEGHYDGFPILPGVVQLAAIEAQIAEQWPALGALVRLERVKFHSPIRPGAKLELHLTRHERTVTFRIIGDEQARSSGRLIYG